MPATNITGAMRPVPTLTNFQVKYTQSANDFIAGRATTVIPVNREAGRYTVFPRSYFLKDEMEPRPLTGAPVETGYSLASDTFSVQEWALAHLVDDNQRASIVADDVNLDMAAVELLTDKGLIRRDRIWAEKFWKSGLWSTDMEGVSSNPGANQFLRMDESGSNPIRVVRSAIKDMARRTGKRPNVLIIGADVEDFLVDHADIVDRIKYTQRGIGNLALLAELLGVENVLTPMAAYQPGNETLPGNEPDNDANEFIVDPKSMLLAHVPQNATLGSPTAMATFAWTGLIPGVSNAIGGTILRSRREESYSDVFHNRMAFDMKLVAPDLGAFFKNAVS